MKMLRPGIAAKSFETFAKLKEALGPAGEGNVWHHIVEQCRVNTFGSSLIQNTLNVIALPSRMNVALNALYSSKQRFITGSDALTVRQWLSQQSFEKQFEFGLKALEMVQKGLW